MPSTWPHSGARTSRVSAATPATTATAMAAWISHVQRSKMADSGAAASSVARPPPRRGSDWRS